MSDRIEMKNQIKSTSRKHLYQRIQKVLFLTILLVGFSTKSGIASSDTDLLTIYHVYSNGEYIGALSDESTLEQLKEEKLNEAKTEYVDYTLTIGTDLSIIPERVFTTGHNDDLVVEKLEESLVVEAKAIGMNIGGEQVLYVNNMTDYDDVLRQLKLKSVTEEELQTYETQKASTDSLPPLVENETRLVEILFSEEVEPVEGQAPPTDILTVDEAITFLGKGTLEDKQYLVQAGDHIGKIASTHNMTTEQLLSLNPGITQETILQVGDEFNVTLVQSFLDVEVHYETKKIQTIQFEKIAEKDSSIFKGENKVTQEGSDGEKEITELIRKKNGETVGKSILEEKVTKEPTTQITVVGTKVTPSRGTGAFAWPAVGGYISSKMGPRWGRSHNGIDIARPSDRTIKASDNGVVTSAGYSGGFGNRVVITHNNGYETLYAHMSSINVRVGQTVAQGAKIGVMGSTGHSTGVHLHFEVRKNGALINPLSVLNR
ncbi:peptidoglycan DD-metalloendopeptidase family protein [Sporosarcina sp. CAU 1771]